MLCKLRLIEVLLLKFQSNYTRKERVLLGTIDYWFKIDVIKHREMRRVIYRSFTYNFWTEPKLLLFAINITDT